MKNFNKSLTEGDTPLLEISNLKVHFDTLDGPIEALNDINLEVYKGQIMGVVGESGCGKSVTSLTTIGLATCDVDNGSIKYDGREMIFKSRDDNNYLYDISTKLLTFFAVGRFRGLKCKQLFINSFPGNP
jgi:ABC-type glutathione transport system ATPase component